MISLSFARCRILFCCFYVPHKKWIYTPFVCSNYSITFHYRMDVWVKLVLETGLLPKNKTWRLRGKRAKRVNSQLNNYFTVLTDWISEWMDYRYSVGSFVGHKPFNILRLKVIIVSIGHNDAEELIMKMILYEMVIIWKNQFLCACINILYIYFFFSFNLF